MSEIPQSIWTSAVELQRYLDSCGYEFLFIGGIAYQRWGEPRVTQDLDLTLVTEFGAELPIIEAVLKRYQSRVPDPINFALVPSSFPTPSFCFILSILSILSKSERSFWTELTNEQNTYQRR